MVRVIMAPTVNIILNGDNADLINSLNEYDLVESEKLTYLRKDEIEEAS